MTERKQLNRWRCLAVGCNPVMHGERVAEEHRASTGHSVARWPVRSAEGERRARTRNRSGYYDRYNVGEKSWAARFGGGFSDGPAFGEGDFDNEYAFGEDDF